MERIISTKRPRLDKPPEVTYTSSSAKIDLKVQPSKKQRLENDNTEHGILPVYYLKEIDVGITEYVNSNTPGFQGVIKQRYTDFIVNEIDSTGEIVHLKDLEPSAKVEDAKVNTENTKTQEEKVYIDMAVMLSPEVSENVKKMIESKGTEPSFVLTGKEPDKLRRTTIHNFFKEHFKGIIISEAYDGAVRLRLFVPKDKKDNRNRDRAVGGEFCQFALYKENKDTMTVINNIAYALNLHPRQFSYAGTKDRRGITTQLVTAKRIKAERIAAVVNRPRANGGYWDGVKVGNFRYVPNELKLGDNKGNHFVITLRNVISEHPDTVHDALASLRDRGFINYFGMQRFGTGAVPTHAIGIALLKGKWGEAVELILKPREGERKEFREAREYWDKNRTDLDGALERFPKNAVAETSVLMALQKSGIKNFVGALNNIPKNLRLMYVHAYQSYVWNHMASERIKLYGCAVPVVGDLVVADDDIDVDIEDEVIKKINEGKKEENQKKVKVMALTIEDLAKYSIYDVVLPQPGYNVIYPANDIGVKYKEFLKKDELDPDNMRITSKEYHMSGDYRKLLARPRNVEWKMLRYNDALDVLSRTDLDIIQDKPEPVGISDGKKLALRLHLTLESSQYATMALREITKADTSAKVQATMNGDDECAEDGQEDLKEMRSNET